jgi:hypothetical protein
MCDANLPLMWWHAHHDSESVTVSPRVFGQAAVFICNGTYSPQIYMIQTFGY